MSDIAKVEIKNKEKLYSLYQLDKFKDYTGDILLLFLGHPYFFYRFLRENPKANVYVIEDEKYSFLWKDIKNVLLISIQEFLEKKDLKKFDYIIMNPPYNGNLHLKILQEAMKHSDDVVNLSPIRWLQDPLAEYKKGTDWKTYKSIREKIENIEVVPKDDVFRLFNITNSEDLGIYQITKNGGRQNFDTTLFCKKCYDKIKDSLCTIDHNMKDGWRIRISSISNSNHRTGGLNNLGKLLIFEDGMKDGKPWYDFYQKNKWSKT